MFGVCEVAIFVIQCLYRLTQGDHPTTNVLPWLQLMSYFDFDFFSFTALSLFVNHVPMSGEKVVENTKEEKQDGWLL